MSELIAKALSKLVEKRPEDPLFYLAKQYPLYICMHTDYCTSFRLETPVISLCSLHISDLISSFDCDQWYKCKHALLSETYIKYCRSRGLEEHIYKTYCCTVFLFIADCRISQSYVLQEILMQTTRPGLH